jgi:hypothetical protein
MGRNWVALLAALYALTILAASCQDAQDAKRSAQNAGGVAQRMHDSASGEGGGAAASDD